MSRPLRVVVAGALANKPGYGGEAWVRLAWVRGLLALGVDAYLLERLDPALLHAEGDDPGIPGHRNRVYFDRVTSRFGLAERSALLGDGDEVLGGLGAMASRGRDPRTSARAAERVRAIVHGADLLVNISGHLRPGDPCFEAIRRRAYIDLDPGFTQMWHARGVGDLGLDAHQSHFTVGWNVGSDVCPVPGGGFEWIPIRQPVMLDEWTALPMPSAIRFTTVASWRGAYGTIEFDGHTYGQKVHEFRKLIDLPARVEAPLELALDIHDGDEADRVRLLKAGWILEDPSRVASHPDAFRQYLGRSGGELSAAQNIYVETASGWFSDRSARYLALGRPVVVQDTGLQDNLPVGRGLLTFRTTDEAARAIESVLDDPDTHGRAARRVAEEHFDAARILPVVLDRALEPGSGGPRFPGVDVPDHADRTVLVSGMIAGVPGQGGASWAVLQYVLGLLHLGYDVHFIEEISGPDADADPAGAPRAPGRAPLACTSRWRYLRAVGDRFGLDGRMTLLERGSRRTAGRSFDDLQALATRARVWVNLSGGLTTPELLSRVPLRLYVDLDPAFTQLWHEQGIDLGLETHTHHASVGLSLGTASCVLPTCGVDWIRTLPPVVLDEWTAVESAPRRDAWTTISHWRGYGSVEWDGRILGQKAHSFRPLMPLPERSGDRFEVALAIHPDEEEDLQALHHHGWRLVNPEEAAGSPDRYAAFVGESAGEIGIAKEGYVASRSGWFSDRSACYLARGRPVLAQDTGFSEHLPTGCGLLAFDTLEAAVAGVDEVRADYAQHARSARAIAEAHLDARRVLPALLAEVDR